jgi:predicted deacylase
MDRRIVTREGRVERGWLSFAGMDVELPYIEIDSGIPGPRLAVMSGIHPNEVSSMEAALRLVPALSDGLRCGTASLLPVVNMPGLAQHTEYVIPIDRQNLNFSFPGSPDGSFTERLAHALTTEWSAGAEVLVDLHGGDLREDVAKFVMVQITGQAAFDARTRELARCYDAELIVEFPPDETANTGRATNALPKLGRHAVMSEAGKNGRLDEASIAFHLSGVLNISRLLGMTDGPKLPYGRAARTLNGFDRIFAPEDGRFYCEVACNDAVSPGQRLAVLRDIFGTQIAEMRAPAAGRVVMIITHNIVAKGELVLSIGMTTDER